MASSSSLRLRLRFAGLLPGLVAGLLGLQACERGTAPVVEGVPALVFVQRAPPPDAGSATAGVRRREGGAMLYRLEPPAPGGALTPLVTADTLGGPVDALDILGADLDFDGVRVVFSMSTGPGEPFHLFTVGASGQGLSQLTFGLHGDEIEPAWLPDGRVVFAGTDGSLDESGLSETTRLTVVRADGTGREALTASPSAERAPSVLRSGRIAFDRWEHQGDRSNVALFTIAPGASAAALLAGNHGDAAVLRGVRQVPEGGVVAVALPRAGTFEAGSLLLLDDSLPQPDAAISLSPGVPRDGSCSALGRFRDPFPLGGNRYLVSWAPGCVGPEEEDSAAAPEFGLFLHDARERVNRLIYDEPQRSELWPLPVRSRPKPEVLEAAAPEAGLPPGSFVLGAVDVRRTGPADVPLVSGAARAVRLLQGIPGGSAGHGESARSRSEAATLLGELPLQADGSFQAIVPAGVPLRLQLLDEFGLAVRSSSAWVSGRPGELQLCVGCHADPPGAPRFTEQAAASAAGLLRAASPGALDLSAVAGHRPLDFARQIQPILDRACATSGCHDATSAPRSYVDLAGELHALRLDGQESGAFSTSYDALLLDDVGVDGAGRFQRRAPAWVVPGDARASLLIRKLNLPSADGARWAFPEPAHPEDRGVSLTTAERRLLAAWVDAGAPFRSENAAPERRVARTHVLDSVAFAGEVHPFLLATCAAQGGCHGYTGGPADLLFELDGDPASDLDAVAGELWPGELEASPLLRKPLAGGPAHGGGALFPDEADAGYELLRVFVTSATPRAP